MTCGALFLILFPVIFIFAVRIYTQVMQHDAYARIRVVSADLPISVDNIIHESSAGAECYALPGSSSCPAVYLTLDAGKTDAEIQKFLANFVSATERTNIHWRPPTENGWLSRDSNVFLRQGRNYQIYIYYRGGGQNPEIAILEYGTEP